jgi:soluble lytic murein transglycosylase-like protein
MASMPSSAAPPDDVRISGTSGTVPPSIRGDRLDGRPAPASQPPTAPLPVRTPSTTTLRVQALADTMSRAATRYRLDPLLLHAIASVESNHNTSARSSAGAIGVMQVMPDTARRFGVREPERELHDPAINIDVSAAYLSGLRSQYENNLPLMLAAYNAGEGAVERHGYRVPPYAETQKYVRRVLNMYDQLHRRTGRGAPRVHATAHVGGAPVVLSAPTLARPDDQAL